MAKEYPERCRMKLPNLSSGPRVLWKRWQKTSISADIRLLRNQTHLCEIEIDLKKHCVHIYMDKWIHCPNSCQTSLWLSLSPTFISSYIFALKIISFIRCSSSITYSSPHSHVDDTFPSYWTIYLPTCTTLTSLNHYICTQLLIISLLPLSSALFYTLPQLWHHRSFITPYIHTTNPTLSWKLLSTSHSFIFYSPLYSWKLSSTHIHSFTVSTHFYSPHRRHLVLKETFCLEALTGHPSCPFFPTLISSHKHWFPTGVL